MTVDTGKISRKIEAEIVSTERGFTGASGEPLNVRGQIGIQISSIHNKTIKYPTGFVVKGAINNLIGRDQIPQLGLIQVVKSITCDSSEKNHPVSFLGLGTLLEDVKVNVDEGAMLINLAVPRRVLLGPQDQVKRNLI